MPQVLDMSIDRAPWHPGGRRPPVRVPEVLDMSSSGRAWPIAECGIFLRMPNDYTIRLAEPADLEQFAEIVNHYIETTAINFHDRPQSEEDWEATWEVLHERYPFIVADKEGVIGGIAYASPWKLRGSYDWTCEVTVYVRSGHERQGLGRALMERVLDILERQGFRSIVAVIALPNDASVALHRALGFEHAGTLKNLGFKLDQWRDVTFWQRNNGDPASPPDEIKPVSQAVGSELAQH